MSNTSKVIGSLEEYILPAEEWCKDLKGLVVSTSKREGWGSNSKVTPVGTHSFNENVDSATAIEKIDEILSPRGTYISSCHMNPTIGADGLVVEGTGRKVSGRVVFTPDNRIREHISAMRLYARAIGEIQGKNVITFASVQQASDFLTIQKAAKLESFQDDIAMSERLSFQWAELKEDVSADRPNLIAARRRAKQ
tara:strand:+ start:330 stop:914 length:585 start_codon:yes stop_codon:yes gene_type:complete